MRRTALLAATAMVATVAAASTADAATEAYLGGIESESRAHVKLRVAIAADETMTVRSFAVKGLKIDCKGDSKLILTRARLSGEIPVGDSGRFKVRDDNGETIFSLRGEIGTVNERAKGRFRYKGDFATGGGGRAECDSGKLRWHARR